MIKKAMTKPEMTPPAMAPRWSEGGASVSSEEASVRAVALLEDVGTGRAVEVAGARTEVIKRWETTESSVAVAEGEGETARVEVEVLE